MKTKGPEIIETEVTEDIERTVEITPPKNGFTAGRRSPHGLTIEVEIPVYTRSDTKELIGRVTLAPGQGEEHILNCLGCQLKPMTSAPWWGLFDMKSRERVNGAEDLYESVRQGRQLFARALMKNEMTRWQRFWS